METTEPRHEFARLANEILASVSVLLNSMCFLPYDQMLLNNL